MRVAFCGPWWRVCAVFAVMVVAGCAAPHQPGFAAFAPSEIAATPVVEVEREKIAALAVAIQALDPTIDPTEAMRAARVSYEEVAYLRGVYQISDPAILHNIKVNAGTRPRGLCWHWAQDMETRLAAEKFETLELHRAIANYDNWRLEHSTVIISARGAPMETGIVLDPWRKGGVLTWMPVRDDVRYDWTPRAAVFAWKRARGTLTTRYIIDAGG